MLSPRYLDLLCKRQRGRNAHSSRFIPESVFYTQSVVRSSCFILTAFAQDRPEVQIMRALFLQNRETDYDHEIRREY